MNRFAKHCHPRPPSLCICSSLFRPGRRLLTNCSIDHRFRNLSPVCLHLAGGFKIRNSIKWLTRLRYGSSGKWQMRWLFVILTIIQWAMEAVFFRAKIALYLSGGEWWRRFISRKVRVSAIVFTATPIGTPVPPFLLNWLEGAQSENLSFMNYSLRIQPSTGAHKSTWKRC